MMIIEQLPYPALSAENCTCDQDYFEIDEPTFRWMLNRMRLNE